MGERTNPLGTRFAARPAVVAGCGLHTEGHDPTRPTQAKQFVNTLLMKMHSETWHLEPIPGRACANSKEALLYQQQFRQISRECKRE
jgi:hypothetical protein